MGTLTYETLEHVAQEARIYPADLLRGSQTGLCLFSAAFLGHNDAVHFAEAGIRTTCVDTDHSRLHQMKMLYPHTWSFVHKDAWEFARAARDMGSSFDVVSVDPFTGDTMKQALADLHLWCSIAHDLVVIGSTKLAAAFVEAPRGWHVMDRISRSQDVCWVVLSRD